MASDVWLINKDDKNKKNPDKYLYMGLQTDVSIEYEGDNDPMPNLDSSCWLLCADLKTKELIYFDPKNMLLWDGSVYE